VSGRADVAARLAGKRRAVHTRPSETVLQPAEVVNVQPGAAADGTALVTVLWQGAHITARYCERYTPTVGHTVLIAHSDDTVYIIDRLIGTL